jgi:hypothetical protein
MRMRADYKVDSMVDEPASELALFISDLPAVFNSPMNQANDKIIG